MIIYNFTKFFFKVKNFLLNSQANLNNLNFSYNLLKYFFFEKQ